MIFYMARHKIRSENGNEKIDELNCDLKPFW